MMSTRSISLRTSRALQPVAGLRTTPTLPPSRMAPSNGQGCGFNVHGKVVATRIDVILETGLSVFNHEVSVKHVGA